MYEAVIRKAERKNKERSEPCRSAGKQSIGIRSTTIEYDSRWLVMTTAALTCPSHSPRRTSRSKGTPRAGLSPEQRQFCSAICPAAAILEWPRGTVCC